MGHYAQVLEGLGKLEGMKALLILSDAGDVVERQGKLFDQAEKLARLATQCLEAGEGAGTLLRRGSLEQSYMEYNTLNVTFLRLSKTHSLVALAASGANLGRIRYEIKRSKKLYEESHGRSQT